MGLPRQNDTLYLGVGQQAVRNHAIRQQGPVYRHGMRHGSHGGGLDQRRRMLDRAGHPHDARPPWGVGTGVGGGAGAGIGGLDRPGLHGQFRNPPPVMRLPRLGGRSMFWPPLLRLRRDRLAEQVAGGSGGGWRDLLPLRHLRDNGAEQLGSVRGAGRPVHFHRRSGTALQHGEAGVEPGAAPGIGAAVYGHGEHAARRRVETADGVARRAMGRRDRHQPAARRQHRGGRADMPEVGVAGDAVHAGRRRKRRVHQHHGRPDVAQPVGDGLRR